MTAGPGWWDAAFGPAYLAVYSHRDDASAAREVRFVAEAAEIRPGDRVLDAACGAGRHARALAALGARVTGIDRSLPLLAEARRRGSPPCVAGDLRALPFRGGAFGRVVSLFTSFGYFDEAGDRAQLAEFRRVLAPGGRLLLDFLNAPRVSASLVPEGVRAVGGLEVAERRAVRAGRVEKDVEVLRGGRRVAAWRESVRLWTRADVTSMLVDAGFRATDVRGDLAGGAWSESSERLVVVAEAR